MRNKGKIHSYLLLLLTFLMSTYNLFSQCQLSTTFSYTGSIQTFVVPIGATSIVVTAWGAGGSGGGTDTYSGAAGGGGAYIKSTVPVSPGQTLSVIVGGGGKKGGDNATNTGGGAGGWGNGVYGGGKGGDAGSQGSSGGGGAGGGASAILSGTVTLIVAGGGGGGSGGGVASSGAIGGGGGQNGSGVAGSCTVVGITGASANGSGGAGVHGGTVFAGNNDGGGGGGGGGGYNGGTGGSCSSTGDNGGCGGGGGSSWSSGAGTVIMNGSGQIPGNTYDLPGGIASGGNGSQDGSDGYVTITCSALPIATISGATTVCLGAPTQTVVFTGTNNVAPYVFTYYINGLASQTVSTIGTSNTVAISVPTNMPGTYTYSLLSIKGADPVIVPCSDITTATVQAWGGGGAGFGNNGGGGGGGAYASSTVTITPGATYTLVVGAGAIGVSGGAAASNGGNSSFGGNMVVAAGGSSSTGAALGAGGTVAASIGTTKNAGGNGGANNGGAGVAGTGNSSGGGGGAGNPGGPLGIGATNGGAAGAGAGAGALGGNGGRASSGNNGSSPGGGGGGAGGSNFGGSGGDGQVSIITNTGIIKTATYRTPGTFTWTAPLCGLPPVACVQPQTGNVVVVVNAASAIGLTSAAGTDAQAVCNSTPITNITYTVTGGGTGANAIGLPPGLTTSFASPTVTISGIPSTVGAYNYTVNITGGCSPPTAVGSITVNPNTSIALTSATGTDAQAVCITKPITTITYTVGNGGTGATATGLPNGVTSSYLGSTLAMTGTPTVSGNYTYTVTTSGGCAPVSINGTINVNPLPTATISSNVTVCKGSASPNVIFTGANATAPYTFTYTINGGANQTISSIAGTTASIVVPTGTVTAFTYSLVNVQESSSTACSQNQTGSSIITIRAPSQGTLSASVHRVCQNSTSPDIVFKGSVGTAPFTFYYSTNVAVGGTTTHSVVSTGSSATVSVSTASPDTIVYTITDVQDASGIVCGIPGNFDTVIIDPLPYSTITAALNDVCLGDPAQPIYFDSYNVGAPVSFDYSISTNGGPAIAQTPLTNGTLTYTLFAPATTLGTTVYTNGVSTSNVCIGGGNGSARLTVNPIPTGTLSLTGSSTICQSGGASQVTFTGSVGKAPFIFSYNVDGAATNTISTLSNQNSVALPLTTLSVGTHTINLLAVKDTFNCAQSQTGAVTIVVDPLPTASAGGNSRICMNGTATVSGASSANGSINWTSDGAGTINNGTTLTPTYSANASDASKTVLLTMTVTSTNSCIGKTATANYTVIIDSLPLAIAGGTATICQGTSNTISNTYSRFGSILWTSNGSGSLSGATSLTPTYTAAAGDAGKLITLTMTVTSTNSCNLKPETATDFYTIKVDPLPTATSPGAQSICENATATVSGASSSNGSVNWTYNGSGTITSGGTTLTPVYAAAAGDAGKTVLLTMTVTSTNSCNVLPAIASSIYTIFVDHLPTAASPGTQSVCENRTATVSGASQNYGTPSWGVTSGAGSITAGGNTLNPTYNANSGDAGNQVILTMTVTSTNSCASQTAMSTYTISVDPLPTATTIGSYTICENASYQLQSGEAVPMYGSPAWTENGAGNITAGATNLTPTYTAAAGDAGTTVTLTMTVTSTNSCNVLPEKAMATYAIDVDPLPIAIAAAAQTICQGDSIILSGANASYGSITWTSNGKGILTNTTTVAPQYHSSAADAGKTVTLTMTVTSTNSCSLPVAAKISTTTAITVRPLLTATLNAQQSVCQNSPAQVIFTVTSKGTPPYTFTYTQDGTQTTATSNASTTASISVPTGIVKKIIYNLTTIQDANCTEPVTIPTQTVTVNPLPYATISQDEDVCRDSTAQKIKIKGSKGATPYTFTFNINNAPTSMTAPDSVLLPPLTDKVGTFVYSLTKVSDFNGCIQTLTDKVTVVVHENPNAIFTVNPERTSILEPEISITDASISASSWMWDFGDGSISASPTPETHTYADTGTYKIKLKVTNSLCKDSTSILVRITLPTSLYVPNTFSPNGDGANDVFKAEGEGIIKFEMMIFDRWGQLLFESNDINKGWDGKVNGGSSPAQMDAYVYVINIRALANKHDYTYRGIVNLIK